MSEHKGDLALHWRSCILTAVITVVLMHIVSWIF